MKQKSITSIDIPQQDGRLKIVTTPSEIQEAIIQQNIKHFTTPESSPLGLGEFLHKAIGDHGTSEFCTRVLQGKLNKRDLEQIKLQETRELFQRMKIPEQEQAHPDQWITEAISYLLEPDMDHPNTSKFFKITP
jgi:hypothetical protein